MKPTKFMTNAMEVAKELRRRCDGSHKHQALLSGRAAGAARYPEALCRAICRGLSRELRKEIEKLTVVAEYKLPSDARRIPDPEEFHDIEEAIRAKGRGLCQLNQWGGEGWATDDLTGMKLVAGK
eukprot:7204816-Karenia_brevis.AAC.1